MKTAVVLMVFAVLLATSFVHESDAFAAGGGSFGKKRTLKNQVKWHSVYIKKQLMSHIFAMKSAQNDF